MSRPVAIVTDSTADIPPALVAANAIDVVPLTVHFGAESFRDGIDLDSASFLARLTRSRDLPTTSQPPVAEFAAVFERQIAAGRDVACITISSALSGTHNAARLASRSIDPTRIRVVDSGTVAMQLGLIALHAARAAAGGADLAGVVAEIESARERSRLFAVLETLEYVHRGGRIGKASQMIGSVLAIKPILSLRDGEVTPLERVRTWRKAIDRLIALGLAEQPLEAVSVMHAGNPADAQTIVHALSSSYPVDRIIVSEAGPVLATYAGPGALGVLLIKQAADHLG